jgi:predicted Zn-dependent protease
MSDSPHRAHASAPVAVLAAALLLLAACAVNPATGKRQFMLVSESAEADLGKSSDPEIIVQFGLYPDDALSRYVSGIGQRLAAQSERPQLDWSFRVLDDPLVNAFALPGGYIYLTRGILAHFNSEAEMASVLGHEIGHVTARHSASQITKAQAAQLGLGLGAILAPEEFGDYGGLATQALGLAFLKFSRDDERQADDLGLRYLVSDGYDPRPMADVFVTLRRSSALAGAQGPAVWLSTHPDPEGRSERIDAAVSRMGRDFSESPVRRDAFLQKIDGIVFGADPRQGYFKEAVFYHPEMKFRLDFPAGWNTQNTRAAVTALSPDNDARVVLSLSRKSSADEALSAFLGQDGVTAGTPWKRSVNGLPTAGSDFAAATSQGRLRGQVRFLEYGGQVYGLLGYGPESRWSTRAGAVATSFDSFRELRDRKYIDVQPARLALVRVDRSMSVQQFARAHGATVSADQLAVINGLDADGRLQAGRTYKVVRGGQLP